MAEQLFASFILDRDQGLEIAIDAESVTEATPITGNIQPLPASVPFLEGIMHLRDSVIPIINLKKRLGLGATKYDRDAKIAVVMLANQRFGLLFDDIREVLRVEESLILPVQAALQSADYIISDLITLKNEQRTLEVLDLKKLFSDNSLFVSQAGSSKIQAETSRIRTYSRYVIFSADGHEYGIPVENSREITFLADIDTVFKTGFLEGALQLRGHTIPVMSAGALLNSGKVVDSESELSRILVMSTDSIIFGMIIDEILEILTVVNEDIFPMPKRLEQSVVGIYEPVPDRNIMLLDVENLIATQKELLKSMARINSDAEEDEKAAVAKARHLITENCYLIFTIGKNFAIELKNVQEIIERNMLMSIPAVTGYDSAVFNLRGKIIPVINLRQFYGYPQQENEENNFKLIICRDGKQVVGLQVDSIVTIYKQEQYYPTPSLNAQLQSKKDTLDRLIEFIGEKQITEHVLVVNTHNLINNHLRPDISSPNQTVKDEEIDLDEKSFHKTEQKGAKS
ncbi:MAG: chemotaxis protein CheW [Proteobacteria bacterium]|nr:chemotaxis protein CheW [Pseudomonadota bacterium]MBU1649346.1 chemotaxis protein CheW [Pseudomonadota bacterium]